MYSSPDVCLTSERKCMQNITNSCRDIVSRRERLDLSQKQLAIVCNLPLNCIIRAESYGVDGCTLIDTVKIASTLHRLEVEQGQRYE